MSNDSANLQADLAVLRPAHLGDLEAGLAEVELDLRAGAELAPALDPGAAAGDVAKPHRDRDPAPVERPGAKQLLARLAVGDRVDRGRLGLFGLEDRAARRGPMVQKIVSSTNSRPIRPSRTQRTMQRVRFLPSNRMSIFSPIRGSISARIIAPREETLTTADVLPAAAEDDRRALDDSAQPVLEALVGDPRFLALDRDLGEAAGARAFGLGLRLARNEGGLSGSPERIVERSSCISAPRIGVSERPIAQK